MGEGKTEAGLPPLPRQGWPSNSGQRVARWVSPFLKDKNSQHLWDTCYVTDNTKCGLYIHPLSTQRPYEEGYAGAQSFTQDLWGQMCLELRI